MYEEAHPSNMWKQTCSLGPSPVTTLSSQTSVTRKPSLSPILVGVHPTSASSQYCPLHPRISRSIPQSIFSAFISESCRIFLSQPSSKVPSQCSVISVFRIHAESKCFLPHHCLSPGSVIELVLCTCFHSLFSIVFIPIWPNCTFYRSSCLVC